MDNTENKELKQGEMEQAAGGYSYDATVGATD